MFRLNYIALSLKCLLMNIKVLFYSKNLLLGVKMRYIEDSLKDKTILITGGAGFIGSNLAFYFQNNHPDAKVVVLDSFRSGETLSNGNLKSFGHFKNLLGFCGEIISGDINDRDLLLRLEMNYKFDYIFHEAAISDTTALEQDLMIKQM